MAAACSTRRRLASRQPAAVQAPLLASYRTAAGDSVYHFAGRLAHAAGLSSQPAAFGSGRTLGRVRARLESAAGPVGRIALFPDAVDHPDGPRVGALSDLPA